VRCGSTLYLLWIITILGLLIWKAWLFWKFILGFLCSLFFLIYFSYITPQLSLNQKGLQEEKRRRQKDRGEEKRRRQKDRGETKEMAANKKRVHEPTESPYQPRNPCSLSLRNTPLQKEKWRRLKD